MTLHAERLPDVLPGEGYPRQVNHNALLTGGGITERLADAGRGGTQVLATVTGDFGERLTAIHRAESGWSGGAVAWVRGVDSYSFSGGHLLNMAPADEAFPGGVLLRSALGCFGYEVGVAPLRVGQRAPITCIARRRGGYYLSGYTPDTTVGLRLRLPAGAPVLVGWETELQDGRAALRMPRAWHRECRLFVDDQRSGVISCVEQHSGEIGVRRRLLLTGLDHATVRFLPEPGTEATVTMLRDPRYPFMVGEFLQPQADADHPGCLTVRDVSGLLLVSW
jgi:hypothetical protein